MSAPGYPVPHPSYPVPHQGYPVPQPGYPSPQPPYPPNHPPYPDPNQPAPVLGFHAYPFAPGGGVPPQQPLPQGYPGPRLDPLTSQQTPGADPHGPITPYSPRSMAIPSGLQYLTQIDQILIHQKVELLEAFISFETKNKYEIRNSMGQKIFLAKEKSDCCTRNCCGSLRQFDMKILDTSDKEVIRLIRPFRCVSCWCPCCLQEMEVQSPPGTTIGFVTQSWHAFLPKFSIQNASKETVLKVVGPCLACSCCGDVNFEVKSLDESQSVGRISKQWSGLLKEVFTDADNFGIQFPMDLDVKIKAVLLGACFLIDFMFFERVGHDKERNTVFS
ncbi:phospholipid scramblase 2 [Microcaecilia unicolor]|uniref:Phospholipid scramblase n=1 Tax=Microcaecilia unicolor TaxID=1415580 RepID=A0A6P7WPG2_9AMPH|nr:phospholipid scramblase 2-like [Microcaecilia unicolor]